MTKRPASKAKFPDDEDSWEFQRPENWPQNWGSEPANIEDLEWRPSRRPQPTRAQIAWTIFVAAAVALLGVAQMISPNASQTLLTVGDREPSGAPPWLGESASTSDFFDRVDARREAWKEWRLREGGVEMDRQLAAAVSAQIAQIAAFGRELIDQDGTPEREPAAIVPHRPDDPLQRAPHPVPGLP